MADFGVLPFLSSSRILSKIITFESMHIPTVNISPAIPGNVNVAPNDARTARIKIIFQINAKFAIPPEAL